MAAKNLDGKIRRRVLNKHFAERLVKYQELLVNIIWEYEQGHTLMLPEKTDLNPVGSNFLFEWARRENEIKYAKNLDRRAKALKEFKGEIYYILETSLQLRKAELPEDSPRLSAVTSL